MGAVGCGASCAGYGSSAAAILVLFILLVIITSAFVW
ncbi:YjcZ family sporulation protein [Paenibacillus sp. 5J-6]|uniref:YjcZ family sporulation protein n=1 Tax=Paenibacillus silvestris TaxID=2606219 RepID=A0A6L8UUB5_9BACL|nr:YjcZ family sporulation protein [Paenibacillus silvestris]MZQ81011.1 YjcZ family sporulation protein [Paenibacillus silvestris]